MNQRERKTGTRKTFNNPNVCIKSHRLYNTLEKNKIGIASIYFPGYPERGYFNHGHTQQIKERTWEMPQVKLRNLV